MQTQSSHQKPLGASPVIRLGICIIKLVPSLIVTPRRRSLEKQMKNKVIADTLGPTLIYYRGAQLIIIMRP